MKELRESGSKVVLFEMNEVPFRILDNFCKAYPKSHIARCSPHFARYSTFSEESGHLSPWRTWPSVHRGVNDGKHEIFDIGQDLSLIDKEHPSIWQILTSNGVSAGVFGSLHTYPLPASQSNYSFYVPDVFAVDKTCIPEQVEAFQGFNLAMCRASARVVDKGIAMKSAAQVIVNARKLGFTPETAFLILKQLLGERFNDSRKVRRRSFQASLSFDVYMKLLQSRRPQFTTFFTNHVASSLHRFWAASFPEDYDEYGYTQEWKNTFSGEIDFSLKLLDSMLGRLFKFADNNPDYEVWMTSSMGQAATEANPKTSALLPLNLPKFMEAMGLSSADWESRPAMLPQVNVKVDNAKFDNFVQKLKSIKVKSVPLEVNTGVNGFVSMVWGQFNLENETDFVTVDEQLVSLDELGLDFQYCESDSTSTAYHIPQGTLMIYRPKKAAAVSVDSGLGLNRQSPSEISTLDIAPAILQKFGVKQPSYMNKACAI